MLIHSGDATAHGLIADVVSLNAWLGRLPHRHKILIAGNHDWCFQREPEAARAAVTEAHYLEDSSVEIEGVRFWGSPWQPWFHHWAFNLERGTELKAKWDLIPADTDVLVTHGPPHRILDRAQRGEDVGCEELRLAVERIQPRLHCFGHIHEAHGREEHRGTTFINSSICTFRYDPIQKPVVFQL